MIGARPFFTLISSTSVNRAFPELGEDRVWDVDGSVTNLIFEELFSGDTKPFWRDETTLKSQARRSQFIKRGTQKHTNMLQKLPEELRRRIFQFVEPQKEKFIVDRNYFEDGYDRSASILHHLIPAWKKPWFSDARELEALSSYPIGKLFQYGEDKEFGHLYLWSFFEHNTIYIGGFIKASPSFSKGFLYGLGPNRCFNLRNVILLIDLKDSKNWIRETRLMVQYLGQAPLKYLKLRIRNKRPHATPEKFQESEIYEKLSSYRNIQELEFEWEVPWPRVEEDLRRQMTSAYPEGKHPLH